MKRARLFIPVLLLVCLICSFALADEQGVPAVRITLDEDQGLSQSEPIEAEVIMIKQGEENVLKGMLHLGISSFDFVEINLPQYSYRFDSEDISFVLFNDGNDAVRTKIMHVFVNDLLAQSTVPMAVPYGEPVEVYINDEYQGLYTLLETMETAIARFEGTEDPAMINIADCNGKSVFGNISDLTEINRCIRELNLAVDEDRQILSGYIDVDSLLNWMAVNVYIGNTSVYESVCIYNVDNGLLKFATNHFSYAFCAWSDNSISRMEKGTQVPCSGLDLRNLTSVILQEPFYRDIFLTKLGALYHDLTIPMMQETAGHAYARIETTLPAHTERWADETIRTLSDVNYHLVPVNADEFILYYRFRTETLKDTTIVNRPWYLYESIKTAWAMTDEELESYLGEVEHMESTDELDNWDVWRESHQ